MRLVPFRGYTLVIVNLRAYHWLPGYFRSLLRRPGRVEGTRHLVFCVADHFEPFGYRQAREKNMARLTEWVDAYPKSVEGFRDADGCTPRHSFFCAAEDYADDFISPLTELCAGGHGEVEIHLHHRDDTAEGLREKLVTFRDQLHRGHGLLGTGKDGLPRYGFVHGNWALCNARPDRDWCGVDRELAILAETGCYADFTFPSAPDPTQPKMVNAIYRAVDRDGGRGQDAGERIECPMSNRECPTSKAAGLRPSGGTSPHLDIGNSLLDIGHSDLPSDPGTPTLQHSHTPLLLIQGPLGFNWRSRKWGMVPRLENADLSRARPPSAERADLWVRQGVHVAGRPEWSFVKVHTHGIVPYNMWSLLGDPMRLTREHLQGRYNDGQKWVLHYVTAREMYNMVRAAEDGCVGNPGEYRDYEVAPPPCMEGR